MPDVGDISGVNGAEWPRGSAGVRPRAGGRGVPGGSARGRKVRALLRRVSGARSGAGGVTREGKDRSAAQGSLWGGDGFGAWRRSHRTGGGGTHSAGGARRVCLGRVRRGGGSAQLGAQRTAPHRPLPPPQAQPRPQLSAPPLPHGRVEGRSPRAARRALPSPCSPLAATAFCYHRLPSAIGGSRRPSAPWRRPLPAGSGGGNFGGSAASAPHRSARLRSAPRRPARSPAPPRATAAPRAPSPPLGLALRPAFLIPSFSLLLLF